jgi:hypothetical protein
MKSVMAFLLLICSALSHAPTLLGQTAHGGLRVEIRTSSSHVHLADQIGVTVLFRSPERAVTIWNALGWGASAGLHLQILDSSEHEIQSDFTQMFHPLPPDRTGKGALISISGDSFAGFDTQLPVNLLFPKPGKYLLRCLYKSPLPRDYFQGGTIWGTEDGVVESAGVVVLVDN